MPLIFSLVQLNLEGPMELQGRIDFPKGKIVIIYGSNQQGKTNVINAIRYNFLKEFKGRGRPREEYDDRTLPTRHELLFGDRAKITTLFEYGNNRYVIEREMSNRGKRETTDLYSVNTPSQKIDPEVFLKSRLKVSLLDVLFAPEITGAFKHLYSGGIDQDVDEMFKGISNLRNLSESFIQRLNRLKASAEAALAAIETAYEDFCMLIAHKAPQIVELEEYRNLQVFEAGGSVKKLDLVDARMEKMVSALRETQLLDTIDEAILKAKELRQIVDLLSETGSVRQKVVQLRAMRSDHQALKEWVESIGQIDRGSRLRKVPNLKDEKRRKLVGRVVSKFSKAKADYRQAVALAAKERLNLIDVPSRIRQLKKILKLLSPGAKVGKEIAASVTKVGGEAYAVLPAELLASDATFAQINNNPVPKGTDEEIKGYAENIRLRIGHLSEIETFDNESQSAYNEFTEGGLRLLRTIVKLLDCKVTETEDEVKAWCYDLAASASSFVGKKFKPISPTVGKELVKFEERVALQTTKAEEAYLSRVNHSLRDLGFRVSRLEIGELTRTSRLIAEEQQALPGLEEVGRLIAEKKPEWQKIDDAYIDYSRIPPLAEEASSVLGEILSKCFDEAKLKVLMAVTYTAIINLMLEKRLIRAVAEVSTDHLKGTLRYRERAITHPAGSEKAFFSLAILTSLAYYFQTPVLIDEVANNLDTDNLKAFFELAREFKDKYGIQYVLSMKSTKDFDLEGWVSELRDDIAVYQIKEKEIKPLDL